MGRSLLIQVNISTASHKAMESTFGRTAASTKAILNTESDMDMEFGKMKRKFTKVAIGWTRRKD